MARDTILAHGFLPAASPKALTSISRTIRRWTLHHRSDKSLQDLAEMYNPCIRGWINYYSHFYETQLRPTLKRIDLYVIDSDGFQVANSLNRFAVSSWMPFKYNADGSLDLYFQNESPGKHKEANWLPAPKGPFNLTMRLYGPKSDALTGKWNPPPITKAQGLPSITAQ